MTHMYQRSTAAFMVLIFFCFLQNAFSQQVNIIPWPQSVEKANGEFMITKTTKIVYDQPGNNELTVAMAPLVLKLQKAAGIKLKSTSLKPHRNFIAVELTSRIAQSEGYHLIITPESIKIEAATPAGIFYAAQSLLQLLPVDIESPTLVKNISLRVPAMIIDDAPAF